MNDQPKTKIFVCEFDGRKSGSIGITYKIKHCVELPKDATDKEIRLKLYDWFELISFLRIDNRKARDQ